MLSAVELPRKSKISSCTPISAKARMSSAICGGEPVQLEQVLTQDGLVELAKAAR